MIFDNLKRNISLNLISCIGYIGFAALIYYIFFSLIMHGKLPFFPLMTLEHACAWLTLCVFLFLQLSIIAIIEPFIINILKIHNKKLQLERYLPFLPEKYFAIGLIIALFGLIFYLYFAIPAISID